MERLLLTISGKDRPGIIARVSGLLFQHGCNLEDISMTLLEGQFAMMMTVCGPRSMRSAGLAKAVGLLTRPPWSMSCFVTGLKGRATRGKKHAKGCNPCVITAFGKDRTGIVHAVSRALAAQKVNITDLDSRILGQGRKVTYAMLLEVDVPARVPLPKLKDALVRVARRLGIEIQLKALDPVSF